LGSLVPSLVTTFADATRIALASPAAGLSLAFSTMVRTTATAMTTTVAVSPILMSMSRLRSAAFRS
jgi:hypothetical protein